MVEFFNQEKQYKLDINITTVTSETTGSLMNTILEEGKASFQKEEICFSAGKGKNTGKNYSSC